ncbi:type I-Fv CRISPR-associated protein Cas5fv [Psychrobacter sp. I-STPA6b]|uniref:type I-Fv CRISPR-associated protein Cas5fv n=1 Tax=Psychrobacter sp. I-STPA6b TaxID=2585718 RepID=UPI001D0C70BA|nr:type I-Fv CRISPR-associated protein Cas5fv [Psychrobacter sp. I-STPA6b]
MRITIEYESSWRNSFLDGSNDEALPKKGRNFVASMTELKKPHNYHSREVTQNTVMGILNRLIGDQRKLYQARKKLEDDSYYFENLESKISFEDKPTTINTEIAYIRNIKGSTDQNSFTGMLKVNDPIFTSNYSKEFWHILALDIEELCDFILDNKSTKKSIELSPFGVLNRLEEIKKLKPVLPEGRIKEASDKLANIFEKYNPLNKKKEQLLLPMYCSALYLQMQRLEADYDMSLAKTKMGGISGISNNSFTPKDFLNKYTTGDKKLIYGNPYIREEFVKGEGKIKQTLTKANGILEINLDINIDKAIELKQLIDYAGVSSFYLGKKGLAYVTDIDIREMK